MTTVDPFVPTEPLWSVFTPEVLEKLHSVANPSDSLEFRRNVLASGGQNPNWNAKRLKTCKAAWEVYIQAAFACRLFEGTAGVDLRARLTDVDDNNFRSALSECLAAWFLAGKCKLPITPRPEGKVGHPLEFGILLPDTVVNVEVKAPYRPTPAGVWWGDDSDLLQSSLQTANKQFKHGDANLLVLVPSLPIPISNTWRLPLERAFIGETIIQIPISPDTGGQCGPMSFPFKESGNLSKKWPQGSDQPEPRFTRVSAVLCIVEEYTGSEIEHFALVVRNPHAKVALPDGLLAGFPDFRFESGSWGWSDAAN